MRPARVAHNRRLFDADPGFAEATRVRVPAIVRICSGWSDGVGMPQGYTYLGQFLAHDIASREFPRVPTSKRTRQLDLDSVYGVGARFDQHGRFIFSPMSARYTKDLLRDPLTKRACIPEFRNDEHPIISQLHLSIQLFHNAAIEAIQASGHGMQFDVARQFEFARKYVVATLQRIYAEDYLREVSDPKIYDRFIAGDLGAFEIPTTEGQLPLEITHAVLRFGHAQVRDKYRLNESDAETHLSELFLLSGETSGADFAGIPHDKRVDWRRFFTWDRGAEGIRVVSGRRINPRIVAEMALLPEPPLPDIVERNLDAGIRSQLPSGQSIAKWLAQAGIDDRISPELQLQPHDRTQRQALLEHGVWDATPLWLFVLIEASAHGGDGMRLGPVGSIFLCETIRSALQDLEDRHDVQAFSERAFALPRIASFRDLVRFAEPETYDKP